jgi:serine O-acetyltransferase
VFERDPACHSYVQAFLFYKGFHALQCHRIAHWLWLQDRTPIAHLLQSRVSELFAVDIHPAARIGRGIMMDHATGIVIGETAVVEDDVSMLHGVTLGGSGKEKGDRHPKVRRGVLLSAGAKVLGNIEIGEYSRVGAGSVVLRAVPANCTVAGVPARVIACAGSERPSQTMDQLIEAFESD